MPPYNMGQQKRLYFKEVTTWWPRRVFECLGPRARGLALGMMSWVFVPASIYQFCPCADNQQKLVLLGFRVTSFGLLLLSRVGWGGGAGVSAGRFG